MSQYMLFKSPITSVETTRQDALGAIRWDGGKCYKYVKFLNTSATVAGALGDTAVYTASDGYEDHEVCLDVDDADAIVIPAGQIQATVTGTLATAYYCWIQIKGFATHSTALGPSVDGTPAAAADGCMLVKETATDKTLIRANDVIDAAGETGYVCGICMAAASKTFICDFPF